MLYEVYKIQNKVNNKIYIGISSQGYKNRFRHHISESKTGCIYLLHKAIRKYGEENFYVTLLEICDSVSQLKEREIFWIKTLDTTNKEVGYNMTIGGDGRYGVIMSEESKDKLRQKATGHPPTKYIKVKITNIEDNKVLLFNTSKEASKYFDKCSGWVKDLKRKYKSNDFIHGDYRFEISDLQIKPITYIHRKPYPASAESIKIRLDKALLARKLHPKEFSDLHKEIKLKAGKTKIVMQFDLDGNFVKEHCGVRDAAKSINGNRSSIQHCLKGRTNKAYGFIWKFKV